MANMLLVVAAAIMMVVNGVAAETYTVGDDSGWTVPSTPDLYTDWAADKNFAVDDVLGNYYSLYYLHFIMIFTIFVIISFII